MESIVLHYDYFQDKQAFMSRKP